MFFTFFYKWYQIAQSITLWFYKEDFHRSMKKWVKRENWNIENKRNIFQATFNVIFFSPVLIFKKIEIEVKKAKKSFLKMYFMFTFSQLQKAITFWRTVYHVYPQFCIWAQKWVNITPASICSVLSTSPPGCKTSLNWTYIRHSEDTFWTSYVRSIYVLFQGGRETQERWDDDWHN